MSSKNVIVQDTSWSPQVPEYYNFICTSHISINNNNRTVKVLLKNF